MTRGSADSEVIDGDAAAQTLPLGWPKIGVVGQIEDLPAELGV